MRLLFLALALSVVPFDGHASISRGTDVVQAGDAFYLSNAEYQSGLQTVLWNTTKVTLQGDAPQISVVDRNKADLGWGEAITSDSSGTLYSAGITAPSGTSGWLITIRQGAHDGKTWETVDEFRVASSQYPMRDLVSDSQGVLYYVANEITYRPSDFGKAIIRASRDRGASWKSLTEISGEYLDAGKLLVDSRDDVFQFGNTLRSLFVRKGRADGAWETVDEFTIPWPKGRATAQKIIQDKTGRIWAWSMIQNFVPSEAPYYGHVRYSDQGGTKGTWKDLFPPGSTQKSVFQTAQDFWVTPSGALMVSAARSTGGPISSLESVIYQSDDRGVTWKVVTSFRKDSYNHLGPVKIGARGILYGRLYATPDGLFSGSTTYLVVSTNDGKTWRTFKVSQP